jgi:hypothetical protein
MRLRLQLGFLAFLGGTVTTSAFLAGAGCTVLTDAALPDDAAIFEGGDAGTASCGACQASACTVPAALCLTDPACISVRTCANVTDCDLACRTSCACGTASTDGGSTSGRYRAFASCRDEQTCTRCSADCGGSCDGGVTTSTAPAACDALDAGDAGDATDAATDAEAGDGGDGGGATDCTGCATARCGEEQGACGAGSECAAFLACAIACTDAACVDDCGRTHATGKGAAVELAACTQASCERECGLGL